MSWIINYVNWLCTTAWSCSLASCVCMRTLYEETTLTERHIFKRAFNFYRDIVWVRLCYVTNFYGYHGHILCSVLNALFYTQHKHNTKHEKNIYQQRFWGYNKLWLVNKRCFDVSFRMLFMSVNRQLLWAIN